MSLRAMPELRCPDGLTGSSALSPKAATMFRRMDAPQAAASDGSDVISVLDVIGNDWWTGEGVTAKRISAALRQIGDRPVTVVINSPGGDFFEGVTIYNQLRAHPAKVTVKIIGLAASAASVIAMAADEIQIAKLGFMMIHNTQWSAGGDRHIMYETGDIMKVFDEACAQMYAERCGEPVASIQAMMDKETWLGGEEVIKAGFADVIADFDLKEALPANAAPALYRLEAALSSGKPMPRAERRRLMKEILDDMPSAAVEPVMPSADDDAIDRLRLAAARLSLIRA